MNTVFSGLAKPRQICFRKAPDALFLGLNFTFDRLITKPAVQLFDSLSRIFYHINSFIVEVISIGMFALASYFIMQIEATEELILYRQLILTLVIDSAVILFGLFPALIYFLGKGWCHHQ